MADSPYIFEANAENFAELVIANSHQVPVMVDFWADWCNPCKMLMPTLTKLADEYQGAFILVKVNTDQEQAIAQQLGIRSLPTIKMFKNGEPVDEFMGVQSESDIRDFIERNRSRQTDSLRNQAIQSIQMGDLDTAKDLLHQVVEAEPHYYEAFVDLAEVSIMQNDTEQAQAILDHLPAEQQNDERVKSLKARLQFSQAEGGANETELMLRLEKDPNDLEALLALANLKVARNEYEAGMQLFLQLMQKDRSFQDDAGRTGMLNVFEMLGGTEPLVKRYRSKMFTILH